MTTSPTITYTLEEFLMRFDQKIDRQFAELKLELKQDIAKLDQKIDRQYAELKQDIKELNQKVSELSADVKALDEKSKGIDKRLENLEFIIRGGLIAFFTGFVGLILKVLGVIPNINMS
ncbi:MAG: hypothetical protein RMK91_01960 [Pseudanabaenaceae cyanobacterium SKYGB_i_bin29]|nr:hypothetical protein [Pseudanabaenaceae cyanobacterium SKYG29]MDW8420614.1 hypothetical protein [Pseudanabaenaceae cyanobacterium SKYGB_i_bin29]